MAVFTRQDCEWFPIEPSKLSRSSAVSIMVDSCSRRIRLALGDMNIVAHHKATSTVAGGMVVLLLLLLLLARRDPSASIDSVAVAEKPVGSSSIPSSSSSTVVVVVSSTPPTTHAETLPVDDRGISFSTRCATLLDLSAQGKNKTNCG
uniref:Uncharacterized protein n=1 Tax=Anopheles atroparvus TaxID=41427 RepID=A0A182J7U1_ANOAO